jgi:hypothetical protein
MCLLISVFTTQDFRIKKKNGVNLFISLKHFTIAVFILASSKLRCFRINFGYNNSQFRNIFILPQHNSTGGVNLELKQIIHTFNVA